MELGKVTCSIFAWNLQIQNSPNCPSIVRHRRNGLISARFHHNPYSDGQFGQRKMRSSVSRYGHHQCPATSSVTYPCGQDPAGGCRFCW